MEVEAGYIGDRKLPVVLTHMSKNFDIVNCTRQEKSKIKTIVIWIRCNFASRFSNKDIEELEHITQGTGIYAAGGECSAITSITIDPLLWGFGNFSINQQSCSAKIPAPSIIALFGLGFARRRILS